MPVGLAGLGTDPYDGGSSWVSYINDAYLAARRLWVRPQLLIRSNDETSSWQGEAGVRVTAIPSQIAQQRGLLG